MESKALTKKHRTGGISVKYTQEERQEIGRRVYQGEFTTHEAAKRYGVWRSSIENYIRLYHTNNGLPARGNSDNPKRQKNVLDQVKSEISGIRLYDTGRTDWRNHQSKNKRGSSKKMDLL